jgi:hypothetical protein
MHCSGRVDLRGGRVGDRALPWRSGPRVPSMESWVCRGGATGAGEIAAGEGELAATSSVVKNGWVGGGRAESALALVMTVSGSPRETAQAPSW